MMKISGSLLLIAVLLLTGDTPLNFVFAAIAVALAVLAQIVPQHTHNKKETDDQH